MCVYRFRVNDRFRYGFVAYILTSSEYQADRQQNQKHYDPCALFHFLFLLACLIKKGTASSEAVPAKMHTISPAAIHLTLEPKRSCNAK